MNRQAIEAAIAAFTEARGEQDTLETDAIDLIADLLIYCDDKGEDAKAIADLAVSHFEEETEAYKKMSRELIRQSRKQ